MKPFIFMYGQRPWPEGLTLLHAYIVVDMDRHPDLGALIRDVRAATKVDPLQHVGDEWFHITLYQFTAKPANQVTQAERQALEIALTERLQSVDPFTVTVGKPRVYTTGIIFDLDSEGPLNTLRAAVADTFQAVFGQHASTYDTGVLHLTESYAMAEADMSHFQRMQRRVRQVPSSRTILAVGAVDLVDVAAGIEEKTITWDLLARIPLGGRPS